MFGIPAIFSPSVIRRTFTITSEDPVFEWNLIQDGFGGEAPSGRSVVTVIVDTDVIVVAVSAGAYPLDLRGLSDNSRINLINNGSILGVGGDGGSGGVVNVFQGEAFGFAGFPGESGGDAVIYDGDGVNLGIDNESGLIFAGGGGGGGGGSCDDLTTGNAGGGGGGGSGGHVTGGKGGAAGSGGTYSDEGIEDPTRSGEDGQPGAPAPDGGGAAGGSGGVGSGCGAGSGGSGGDFGAAGSSGVSSEHDGGGGGEPGLAINNDGTGATTFLTGGTQGTDYKGAAE